MKFKVYFSFFVLFFRYRGSMPLRMAIFTVFLPKVTLQHVNSLISSEQQQTSKSKWMTLIWSLQKLLKLRLKDVHVTKDIVYKARIWKLKTQYYTTRMNSLIILSDKWQSKDQRGCRNFLKFPAVESWFTLFRFAYLDIL